MCSNYSKRLDFIMEKKGGMELLIPESTVEQCQNLQQGQILFMTGQSQKHDDNGPPADISIEVKKNNCVLSMYFAAQTMGDIFNERITEVWQCHITDCHILEPEPEEVRAYPSQDSFRKSLQQKRESHKSDLSMKKPYCTAEEQENDESMPIKNSKRMKTDDGKSFEDNVNGDVDDFQLEDSVDSVSDNHDNDNYGEFDADFNVSINADKMNNTSGDVNVTETEIPTDSIKSPPSETSKLVQNILTEAASSTRRKWTKSDASKRTKIAEITPTIEDIKKLDFKSMKLIEKLENCDYYCLYCGTGFETEDLKIDHMNEDCEVIKVAKNSGENPLPRFAMPAKSRTGPKSVLGQGQPADKTHHFICRYCDQAFKSPAPRRNHEKNYCHVVLEHEKLICNCWKEFKNEAEIHCHKKLCTVTEKNRWYPCEFCSEDFSSPSERSEHFVLQHEDLHIVCRLCVMDFSSKDRLKLHMLSKHKGDGIPETEIDGKLSYESCKICFSNFATRGSLVCHMFNLHPDDISPEDIIIKYGKNCYPCGFCDGIFTNTMSRHIHQTKHCPRNHKKHQCADCKKYFQTVEQLAIHSDISHKLTVNDTNNIRMNSKVKKRNLRYLCKSCGFDFQSSDERDAHRKEVHPERKIFVCSWCGAQLKSRTAFSVHKDKHIGLPPKFQCPQCPVAFPTKYRLEEHLTSHSDERNCVCEHCGHGFKTRSQMYKHIQTIHKNQYPYHCHKCGHGVCKKKYLDNHICGRVRRIQDNNTSTVIRNLDKKKSAWDEEEARMHSSVNIQKPQVYMSSSVTSNVQSLFHSNTDPSGYQPSLHGTTTSIHPETYQRMNQSNDNLSQNQGHDSVQGQESNNQAYMYL